MAKHLTEVLHRPIVYTFPIQTCGCGCMSINTLQDAYIYSKASAKHYVDMFCMTRDMDATYEPRHNAVRFMEQWMTIQEFMNEMEAKWSDSNESA